MNVNAESIRIGLRQLGLEARDVAVHASLRSFGHVVGGGRAFKLFTFLVLLAWPLAAYLAARAARLGPAGAVAAAALSLAYFWCAPRTGTAGHYLAPLFFFRSGLAAVTSGA